MTKGAVSLELVIQIAVKNLSATLGEDVPVVRFSNLPVVQADEALLALLVQNLLSNASQFRKPDARSEVLVSARLTAGLWVVSVADNGLGFESNQAERIFRVFGTSDGEHPGRSNGIGLAISKRIVEQHGGAIWADSEAGVGSTFYFTLPTATRAQVEQAAPKRSRAAALMT